jgi:hypothetical protein
MNNSPKEPGDAILESGFKLNLLRKVINSLKFYNAAKHRWAEGKRKFLCDSL